MTVLARCGRAGQSRWLVLYGVVGDGLWKADLLEWSEGSYQLRGHYLGCDEETAREAVERLVRLHCRDSTSVRWEEITA